MFSIQRLKEIIASSEFDALVGEVENDWFECKGQPYHLKDDDTGKRELVKDVSSFANYKGGYIFIGIKTKKSPTHFGDEVEEIRPFESHLVDTNQYQNIIRSWIYPELEEITITWMPVKENRGIVVIHIPPQKDTLKPFIIKNVLDEKKKVEIVFGYAERRRDNSQPLSVIDLQRALRSGLNFENTLKERLDSLEALIKQSTNSVSKSQNQGELADLIDKRITNTLSSGKLGQSRALIITAYPNQQNELKTVFQSSQDSVKKHLENPPTLRHGGWALLTHDAAKIIRGELVRAGDANYKVIDLYRDGTMIFAVLADDSFLAWGQSGNPTKINPLALVEVVYNFFSLYKLVLDDLKEKPEIIAVQIDLRNLHLNGNKSFLVPYAVNSWAFMSPSHFEMNEAPDTTMTKFIQFPADKFSVGKVAFEVLKEIYLWFGLNEDEIPYTKVEGNLKTVDPEKIQAV